MLQSGKYIQCGSPDLVRRTRGYTEFYATDPATLLAAWRRSEESSKG
jgi:hypothetical protein